jgi:hypothetical protein
MGGHALKPVIDVEFRPALANFDPGFVIFVGAEAAAPSYISDAFAFVAIRATHLAVINVLQMYEFISDNPYLCPVLSGMLFVK